MVAEIFVKYFYSRYFLESQEKRQCHKNNALENQVSLVSKELLMKGALTKINLMRLDISLHLYHWVS